MGRDDLQHPVTTRRALEVVLSRLKFSQQTAGDLRFHLSAAVQSELKEAKPMIKDEAAVEAKIAAKGLSTPRVTPDQVDAEIVGVDFHVFPGSCLTVCALTLRNGFVVTGESACADPASFDAGIGRDISRANAREKIWPLLGFRLRDSLVGEGG